MKTSFLCFFLFWFTIAPAQEFYKSFHYTTDEGLPSNTIYSITENKEGTIVLGTDNGLTFFDGNDFKTLNVKEGLINPNIVAVANDANGTIWFINYGGKLQRIVNHKIYTTTVFCDYYNQILNTKKSLFLYTTQAINKNNGYTNIELFKQKGLKINADTLIKTPKMAAPALVQNGEDILFKNNYLFYKQYKIPLPKNVKLLHKVIFRKENVCVLDEFNLFIVDFKGKILNTIKLPQPLSEKRFSKYDFIEDHQNNLWLNIQGKGLFVLKNNRWISQQKSLGLSIDENINFLFCDSKGRLWIATNQNGLFCIPNTLIEIIDFEIGENNFKGFATASDYQSFFIATNFSLYLFKNNQINLLYNTVHPIKIDNIDTVPIYYFPYFKAQENGIKTKELTKIPGKQLIKKEAEKYYSLFGISEIVIHDKKNSATKDRYISNKNQLKEKIVKVIYHNKEYYFSNREKINVRTFDENYIYVKRELKFKIKGFIQDFTFINDTMWVAANNVVYKIFNEKIVDSLTHINGLELSNIKSIKQIGQDKFLCTGIGLFKISKEGNRVLNKYNFLPSNDVNNVILFRDNFFVATSNGLGKINAKIISEKTTPPFVNVFFKNKKVNRVNIPAEVENVNLQIKIQNFYSPKNKFVQYQIDHSPWSISNDYNLIIPVQSYGKHVINIRAKDINSDWSLKTITIYRAYPYYYKWWFITIVIVLFLLLLFGFYHFQMNKLKKRKQQEIAINNKIVELRQNALSALMNPHFMFNSLSSIQYFINSNEPQKSSDYLAKFARLARLFLSHASSPTITLEKEINRLNLYIELEQVRFNNFKYNLEIDKNIDLDKTIIPNMILQPFVENAILHGISSLPQQDGEISLRFSSQDEILTIEISDTGFGVDLNGIKKRNHISKGVKIIKERIALLQLSHPDKEFSIHQESLFPEEVRKGHKVILKITLLS